MKKLIIMLLLALSLNIQAKDIDSLQITIEDNIVYIDNSLNETYYIYDITGKLVYEGKSATLWLPQGYYIVKNKYCTILIYIKYEN